MIWQVGAVADEPGRTGWSGNLRKGGAVQQRKKILLVDDSRTALLMTQMLLDKGTFDFVTASDGAEALAKARQEMPDIIVMDVVMPNMNGFEACRALREDAATKGIPIIMVTTRAEEKNVELGYESGCNDYVLKPVNGLELMEKIRNYVGS
jgi:CheY-like chemotaxis protein